MDFGSTIGFRTGVDDYRLSSIRALVACLGSAVVYIGTLGRCFRLGIRAFGVALFFLLVTLLVVSTASFLPHRSPLICYARIRDSCELNDAKCLAARVTCPSSTV